MRTLEGHNDWVQTVKFSPDGKYLLSGGKDNSIRVCNYENGMEIKKFENAHRGAVTSLVFSKDGNILFSGSWDNTIKMWSCY